MRDTYTVFSKIGNDINKDLKILKIISFYFQILGNIRNYSLISAKLEKVIYSLNSTPINSNIVNKIKLYKANDNKPITQEEWNSIGQNETIYLKEPYIIPLKIKHFNESILDLKNIIYLVNPEIELLNVDGLIQKSLIKYNTKLEKYSKK